MVLKVVYRVLQDTLNPLVSFGLEGFRVLGFNRSKVVFQGLSSFSQGTKSGLRFFLRWAGLWAELTALGSAW